MLKFTYLFAYFGFAGWIVLFNLYLKDVLQLTGFQIGSVAALQQFNSIWVIPIWGFLADRRGRRPMLLYALGLTVLALLFFVLPNTYGGILLTLFFVTMVHMPISSLIDSLVLDHVAQQPGLSYGELRLWASMGWAVGAFFMGRVVSLEQLWFIFPIASFFLLLCFLVVFFGVKSEHKPQGQVVRLNAIWQLLRQDSRLRWFLAYLMVLGVVTAPTALYINVYYADIGTSYSQLGLAFLVMAGSELPFFFYGSRIVARWGARKALLASLGAQATRLFLFSLIQRPEWAIALGVAHGLALALTLVANVHYLQSLVPGEYRASGQALYYASYAGVGAVVGNLLLGYLKDHIGIQQAMFYMAILAALLVVALAVFGARLGRRR